jgi:hypothetical protein
MTEAVNVYLDGGPDDLPDRVVPPAPSGNELKIPHLGGYEHFRATPRRTDTSEGPLVVYEWYERTEVAG